MLTSRQDSRYRWPEPGCEPPYKGKVLAMSEKLSQWYQLPLRLVLGISFVYHGLPKVSSVDGHQAFAKMLEGIGVPASDLVAWAVGLVEIAGGVALIVGAFVVVASILLTCDMLVALFKVHLAAGFSLINIKGMGPDGPIFGMPGYEVNLLYIAALLTLILAGAGALSVDQVRGRQSHRYRRYSRK